MDIIEKSIVLPALQPAIIDIDSVIQSGFTDVNDLDDEFDDVQDNNKENLPPTNVVEPPVTNNHMICPICLAICRDPIEVPCCHHWFCTFCFLLYMRSTTTQYKLETRHLSGSPESLYTHLSLQCPYCKVDFKFHSIQRLENLSNDTRLEYFEQKVKCPNKCGYKGSIGGMEIHQFHLCRRRKLFCPNFQCPERLMEAGKLRAHFLKCIYKRVHCLNCGYPMSVRKRRNHNCARALAGLIKNFQKNRTGKNLIKLTNLRLKKINEAFFEIKKCNAFWVARDDFQKYLVQPPLTLLSSLCSEIHGFHNRVSIIALNGEISFWVGTDISEDQN